MVPCLGRFGDHRQPWMVKLLRSSSKLVGRLGSSGKLQRNLSERSTLEVPKFWGFRVLKILTEGSLTNDHCFASFISIGVAERLLGPQLELLNLLCFDPMILGYVAFLGVGSKQSFMLIPFPHLVHANVAVLGAWMRIT